MSRIRRRAKEAAAALKADKPRPTYAAELFNEALQHGPPQKIRRIFGEEGVPITGEKTFRIGPPETPFAQLK